MSNRNNDVFNVLPTKGNVAMLAKDLAVESLAVGQLGAFNADTNVSVDSTVSPLPRNIYFAVGVDKTGSNTLEDIRTSAGQAIQRQGIVNYSFQPHTAGRPMVLTVGGYLGKCETEYGIRVEFRNSRINRIQGRNQYSKTYLIKTGCCDTCDTGCSSADANTITQLLIAEIAKDTTGILVAKAVARQAVTTATHGTSVDYAAGVVMTDADVQALITFNALSTTAEEDKVYTDITLTPTAIGVSTYFQVNLSYHKFLETIINASLIEGFNCSGTVVTTTDAAFAEGTGVNIQNKEYHASGWNGAGPYVLSETTGTPKGNIQYLSVAATNYDQFILEYDVKSQSGFLEYENPLSTIIAVPATDTVTRASVATFLDALTPDGFENLADDVALASTNPAVVEAVVAAVTTDGIA